MFLSLYNIYALKYFNLFITIFTERRQWHPTPVLLPGKSYGQRSLVGYSPWGRKESDTTEQLHVHVHHYPTSSGEDIEALTV